jgi:hypothetical protein
VGRLVRAAWTRRGTLTVLFSTMLLLVSGCVMVLALAEDAGTSSALAAPLVLLGVVALPAVGARLASERRAELGLARVRGRYGLRLVWFAAAEPLLTLVLAAAVGMVLGAAGAAWAGRAWFSGSGSVSIGGDTGVAVAGLVIAALVCVMIGHLSALRAPIADQVQHPRSGHPRSSSSAALFLQIVLLLAALLVAVRVGRDPSVGPDWLKFASPALVGLAAGQCAWWLLRFVADQVRSWSAERSLPAFLAVRSLSRRHHHAAALRMSLASSAVAVVALGGTVAVDSWVDDAARLEIGAPQRVSTDRGALAALTLTRDLDPTGSWLMAAAFVDSGRPGGSDRRAFIDSERYEAVLGDFYDDTAAAAVEHELSGLQVGNPVAPATGDTMELRVESLGSRATGKVARLIVSYVNDEGAIGFVVTKIVLARHPTATRAAVEGCSAGCVVTGLAFEPTAVRRPAPRLLITEFTFAGTDVLKEEWTTSRDLGRARPRTPVRFTGDIVERDQGLAVLLPQLAFGSAPIVAAEPASTQEPLGVLATSGLTLETDRPRIAGTDGNERPARVADTLPALPLVSGDGVLADLPRALVGAGATVPDAEVFILARSDTPADLVAALQRAGGGAPQVLADQIVVTRSAANTGQSNVYLVIGAMCLALALIGIAGDVGRQRAERGLDTAALRVIGVDVTATRRAHRIEVTALTCWTAGAVAVTAAVVPGLLLPSFPLAQLPSYAVPLDTGLGMPWLLAAVVLTAGVTAFVGSRVFAGTTAQSRPATLREDLSP